MPVLIKRYNIKKKKLTWESKSSNEGYLQPSVSLVSCGENDYNSFYLVSRTEFFIFKQQLITRLRHTIPELFYGLSPLPVPSRLPHKTYFKYFSETIDC